MCGVKTTLRFCFDTHLKSNDVNGSIKSNITRITLITSAFQHNKRSVTYLLLDSNSKPQNLLKNRKLNGPSDDIVMLSQIFGTATRSIITGNKTTFFQIYQTGLFWLIRQVLCPRSPVLYGRLLAPHNIVIFIILVNYTQQFQRNIPQRRNTFLILFLLFVFQLYLKRCHERLLTIPAHGFLNSRVWVFDKAHCFELNMPSCTRVVPSMERTRCFPFQEPALELNFPHMISSV